MNSTTARSALETTIVSGVIIPETIASPRPGAALMSSWSDRPLTGWRVKTMAAARAGTSAWTTTAIASPSRASPRRAR